MLKKKTFLIKKIFFIILPISIAACSLDSIKNKFSNNQPKETQIRIVGLDGEYRPINRQIPALNSDLLISQQQNPVQNNSEEAAKKENANSQNLNSLDNFGPSDQPLLESSNLNSTSAAASATVYSSNQEKEEVINWHVYPDGLRIWRDGELIAVIEHDVFPHLIKQLAEGLLDKSRSNITDMYS